MIRFHKNYLPPAGWVSDYLPLSQSSTALPRVDSGIEFA